MSNRRQLVCFVLSEVSSCVYKLPKYCSALLYLIEIQVRASMHALDQHAIQNLLFFQHSSQKALPPCIRLAGMASPTYHLAMHLKMEKDLIFCDVVSLLPI